MLRHLQSRERKPRGKYKAKATRYCQRRATAGSTRSARQAGSAAAASAMSRVNTAAAAYTNGSAGLTPTSIAAARRASAAAASVPTSRPTPANANPCRNYLAHDVPRLGAQRHANTDLAGALLTE